MQHNKENPEAFLEDYYENLHSNNGEIIDANNNTLKKISQNRIKKKLKDQKDFLIALNVFKNSNRKTKNYSDILVGLTEEVLLDGDNNLDDRDIEFLLCLMDVYSATNSSSFQMETHIAQIEKRANLFYPRKKGKDRLEIVNMIITAMEKIVNIVQKTVSPIQKFAEKVLEQFEKRLKLYSSRMIHGLYSNVSNLERGIMSTHILSGELRIIEPEHFNEKFNKAFYDYIKKTFLTT